PASPAWRSMTDRGTNGATMRAFPSRLDRSLRRGLFPVTIPLRIGPEFLVLGIDWVLVAPVALWAIATIYVPIITPGLRPIEAWGVALGILAAVVASLAGHALAHVGVTKIGGGAIPPRLPIHLCGDAAQVWAPALPPGREALVAIAGPAANLLIAAAGYLLWDGQFHPYLNGSALFVALFNLGIALVNLAPGFPLDGGRVTRALVWEMLRRPGQSTAAARWLGILVISGLVGWGVLLAVQQVRFSLVTGITTLLLAGLLALALWG